MIALLKARCLSDIGVALYQEKKFPRHLRFRKARLQEERSALFRIKKDDPRDPYQKL